MKAVIVGGGVAGPAVGMALHRAGIESVLLERRPLADPETGSYLTVSPNGLDALAAIVHPHAHVALLGCPAQLDEGDAVTVDVGVVEQVDQRPVDLAFVDPHHRGVLQALHGGAGASAGHQGVLHEFAQVGELTGRPGHPRIQPAEFEQDQFTFLNFIDHFKCFFATFEEMRNHHIMCVSFSPVLHQFFKL